MAILQELSQEFLTLIKYLWNRQLSVFVVVFGRRGSGKTDFSLLLAEILNDLGIVQHFATNIKIYNSRFHIEEIDNLENLTAWAQTLDGKKLFILDEVGQSMPRRSPMAKLNVEMIKKIQLIRKYKLSLIFDTINQQFTDGAFLGSDVLDGVFTKPIFNNPKILLYDDYLEDIHLQFSDVPRASIKFDTWDSAEFKLKQKIQTPQFNDETLQKLWEYAHGKKIGDLWSHSQAYKRDLQKYLRESLKVFITHHKTISEGSTAEVISQKSQN